jgi:peptidoglycan glycosyltransferase
VQKKSQNNKEFLVIMYLFFVLFLMMMAYFVYFQICKSESFINSPYNSLQDLFSEHVIRGDILSADGEVLATTTLSDDGTQTREYPYGRMFAHAVGYSVNGKAGLENQENFSLLRSHEFFLKQIADDLSDTKSQGDNVVTTLDTRLQKAAYEGLGNNDGAVIVMEPSTGKILAMVSKPDFDPATVKSNWDTLTADGSTVLYNRATQGKYAPGSVFKIVTALEYYRENQDTYDQYTYQCDSAITVDGSTIHCAGNQKHGQEDLQSSFAHSCNTSFANLSLSLDLKSFRSTCDDLLFNKSLPIAFESSKSSVSLSEEDSTSMVMETGIGQGKTLVSPLHMVMLASAVDQNGILMTPYLVDHTENADGVVVSTNNPKEYGSLMNATEAGVLQELMRSVVTSGTGTALSGQSYEASGKTGTAQVSDTSDQTNAWFVGYAKKDGYADIAIAVIVENSGGGSAYAIPIAKKVFDVYFNK